MIFKRISVSFLVLLAYLLAGNVAVAADSKPSGTITIESWSVALGFGVNWGQGTLNYNGKKYKFKVNGLSVIDLGVSKVKATGTVYNLDNLSDFAGTYTAAAIGANVAVGVGAARMENGNDVIIELTSEKDGVQFTLAGGGVKIKLTE
jgi:hypothetical protein